MTSATKSGAGDAGDVGDVPCPRCHGEGERRSSDPVEEERGIAEVCYHCAGTRRISTEQAAIDRVEAFACRLAAFHVARRQRAADHDPDGEGFALAAAENMMTLAEYTETHESSVSMRIGRALAGLDPFVLETILDAVDNLGQRACRNRR